MWLWRAGASGCSTCPEVHPRFGHLLTPPHAGPSVLIRRKESGAVIGIVLQLCHTPQARGESVALSLLALPGCGFGNVATEFLLLLLSLVLNNIYNTFKTLSDIATKIQALGFN